MNKLLLLLMAGSMFVPSSISTPIEPKIETPIVMFEGDSEDYTDLQNQITNLQAENNRLNRALSESQNTVNQQKTTISGLQQTISDLQSGSKTDSMTISSLNNKVSNLENSLSSSQNTISNLESQLNSEKAARAEAENKLAVANQQLNTVNSRNDSLQSAYSGANDDNASLSSQLSASNNKVANANSRITELENQLSATQAELNTANNKIASLEKQLDEAGIKEKADNSEEKKDEDKKEETKESVTPSKETETPAKVDDTKPATEEKEPVKETKTKSSFNIWPFIAVGVVASLGIVGALVFRLIGKDSDDYDDESNVESYDDYDSVGDKTENIPVVNEDDLVAKAQEEIAETMAVPTADDLGETHSTDSDVILSSDSFDLDAYIDPQLVEEVSVDKEIASESIEELEDPPVDQFHPTLMEEDIAENAKNADAQSIVENDDSDIEFADIVDEIVKAEDNTDDVIKTAVETTAESINDAKEDSGKVTSRIDDFAAKIRKKMQK